MRSFVNDTTCAAREHRGYLGGAEERMWDPRWAGSILMAGPQIS